MAAPKTVATYDLNGSTREFDFAFDYLARSFVKVSLIGTERVVLQVGTDYTFVSANRIRTNVIYGAPDYQQIEIRRETSTTDRLVDFQDASILRADDLDLSQLQVLHVAEEAREAATETIGVNNAGELDSRGRRIVNVGNSVGRQDAMTYGQYLDDRSGTAAARVAAEAARDKAKEWATKTGIVEGSLKSSKGYAEDSAAQAQASAASAASASASASASAASASASQSFAGVATSESAEAEQSASAAASAASDAYLSMETSRKWATNPENVEVAGGEFSALHWSRKAETWAAQAGSVPLAVQQVAAAVRSLYQGFIGVPIPWPSESIPAGYLPMDGRVFDTAANPVLAQKYPLGTLPDLRRMFIRGSGAGFVPLSTQGSANLSHSHGVTVESGGGHGHTGSAASAGGHTHTLSGTANSAGSHYHAMISPGNMVALTVNNYVNESNRGEYSGTIGGSNSYPVYGRTSTSGEHTHTVSGTADSAGYHTHTVTIDAGGAHTHTGSASASGESESRPVNTAFMYICMTDAAIPALPTIGT